MLLITKYNENTIVVNINFCKLMVPLRLDLKDDGLIHVCAAQHELKLRVATGNM